MLTTEAKEALQRAISSLEDAYDVVHMGTLTTPPDTYDRAAMRIISAAIEDMQTVVAVNCVNSS